MKEICISNGIRLKLPNRVWMEIAIYKLFWPPDKVIQLGKQHKVRLRDIDITPPSEQIKIDI